MKPSDTDPIGALFGAIGSSFSRGVVAWLTISVGISVPWLFADTGYFNPAAALFWPVYAVIDLIMWGAAFWGLGLAALLLGVWMIWTAWQFVTDAGEDSRGTFWLTFSLPFLLSAGPPLAWRWLAPAGVWTGLTLVYYGFPWLWRRHAERRGSRS